MRFWPRIVSGLSLDIQRQLGVLLYFVPVLLGVGIAGYFLWPQEPGLVRPVLLTLLFLSMSVWLRHQGQAEDSFIVSSLICLALFWVCLGFSSARLRSDVVASPILSQSVGPIWVEGQVRELEQLEGKKGYRLILSDLEMRGWASRDTPRSIRLSFRKGGEDLRAGMIIRVLAKIEPPSPPATPGGFDYRRHAYFKQIGGYGYALGTPTRVAGPRISWWGADPEHLRNAITARVNAVLAPQSAAVVAALLTGERAAINEANWQALRDSGLAHLLAISGANVDMVALVVFFLVRGGLALFPRLALHYPIKKYAAVLAFLVTLAYVLLIAPSTPTMRALITIGVVLLAILLDRPPISLRLVCFTASVILLIWPEQLLSPSFQLSFAAVTALVAVFEWVTPWLSTVYRDATWGMRVIFYVVGVCATTIIATLATAPISLFHFQTLAVYGVLANALAVPLMTFVMMPLALLAYPAMAVGFDLWILWALGLCSDGILGIAQWTASLPGARFSPPAMPLESLLGLVGAGLMLALLMGRLRLLAVLPLAGAIVILIGQAQATPDAMVSGDGRLMMVLGRDGQVTSSTKRFARRLQGDWAAYWGVDEKSLHRLKKGESAQIILRDGSSLILQASDPQPLARLCASLSPTDCKTLSVVAQEKGEAPRYPVAIRFRNGEVKTTPVRPRGQGRPWQPTQWK